MPRASPALKKPSAGSWTGGTDGVACAHGNGTPSNRKSASDYRRPQPHSQVMDNGIATSSLARYKALSARRRRTDAELDEATVSTVPDTGDDPEVTLQKKNLAEALRQSLLRLSPDHREVIDLAYYHGKSVKEIAEIVSISEATVKTRMFYARRKLAELVETT